MRITATVVKISADKCAELGASYNPEKLWVAYWNYPGGPVLIGHEGRDKADALSNLRVVVLKYFKENCLWETVDEGEIDL